MGTRESINDYFTPNYGTSQYAPPPAVRPFFWNPPSNFIRNLATVYADAASRAWAWHLYMTIHSYHHPRFAAIADPYPIWKTWIIDHPWDA
jgi:hypothetical protein